MIGKINKLVDLNWDRDDDVDEDVDNDNEKRRKKYFCNWFNQFIIRWSNLDHIS